MARAERTPPSSPPVPAIAPRTLAFSRALAISSHHFGFRSGGSAGSVAVAVDGVVCIRSMSLSKMRGALLAGLFLACAMTQIACGLLHCVSPIGTKADGEIAEHDAKPPCHGDRHPSSGTEPSRSDDEGACCVTFPAEIQAASSLVDHAGPIVAFASVTETLPSVLAPSTKFVPVVETGPPAWLSGSANLPLRI